jgi:hypothetical protein
MKSSREEAFFELALARPPNEHPELLAAVCGDDADLSQRVEALLVAHEQLSGFLTEGNHLGRLEAQMTE